MNDPMSVEVMALAGFEWLVIDIEHTSIDLFATENLIRTIQANNMKALVRVSRNEEVIIKKVLDMFYNEFLTFFLHKHMNHYYYEVVRYEAYFHLLDIVYHREIYMLINNR